MRGENRAREFSRAGRLERYRNRAPDDAARLAAIDSRADRLRDRAKELHAARYGARLDRARDKLRAGLAPTHGTQPVPENTPVNPEAGLEANARAQVERRLAQRLHRIEQARRSDLARADFARAAAPRQ
jgi:hypothetical protein